MPLWFIQILLIAIAIYRFNNALKYMRSEVLFQKEIFALKIDKSKFEIARNVYFILEVIVLIFLVTFPFLSTINFLKPYLMKYLIYFLIIWSGLSVVWFFKYSENGR